MKPSEIIIEKTEKAIKEMGNDTGGNGVMVGIAFTIKAIIEYLDEIAEHKEVKS